MLSVSRLKMGYFCWLYFEDLNHPHTELNLGDLNDTKFYHISKASFIRVSRIASFKPFLIAWLWDYCPFSDSCMAREKSLPLAEKHPEQNYFTKTKTFSTIKRFSSSSNHLYGLR